MRTAHRTRSIEEIRRDLDRARYYAENAIGYIDDVEAELNRGGTASEPLTEAGMLEADILEAEQLLALRGFGRRPLESFPQLVERALKAMCGPQRRVR